MSDCCSAASDYRKRRKSEPSSSQVNAQSQSRAATSPKPVDAYRPSSSLKKPVIRSSPSSPSRAKGTHTYAQTSFSFCLFVFLFSLLFPRLSYECTILTTSPENQRRCVVICCVFSQYNACLVWSYVSLIGTGGSLKKKHQVLFFFPTLFSLLILLPLPSSSIFLLGITA